MVSDVIEFLINKSVKFLGIFNDFFTEKSLKIPKKLTVLLIKNSMTSETMLAQSFLIGFKWEIGCAVPKILH